MNDTGADLLDAIYKKVNEIRATEGLPMRHGCVDGVAGTHYFRAEDGGYVLEGCLCDCGQRELDRCYAIKSSYLARYYWPGDA